MDPRLEAAAQAKAKRLAFEAAHPLAYAIGQFLGIGFLVGLWVGFMAISGWAWRLL